jgi:hypothetical protein
MSLWQWLATSRHTRWLEEEVERLRQDRDEARRQVWALINSLVTTAGAPLPQEILQKAAAKANAGQDVKPMAQRGKKSWHQRAMALEIQSTRELQSDLRGHGAPKADAAANGSRAVSGDEAARK